MFGFNKDEYDLNLINSFSIPYCIGDKEIEPTVIKKSNDSISFKNEEAPFIDMMKLLRGAKTLDSFLKSFKASETQQYYFQRLLTMIDF